MAGRLNGCDNLAYHFKKVIGLRIVGQDHARTGPQLRLSKLDF